MSKVSGVIFDCDGTLFDSLGRALESFNYALKNVGESPRTIEEIKKYFGTSADRIFFRLLGDAHKAEKAFHFYLEYQGELAKHTPPHKGILQLLDQLKKLKIPMAIVTGRHEADLELVLKPYALESYFEILVADSHLKKSKPDPEGIFLAAKAMNVDLQSSFYVGDSVTDMQAAKNAGCGAIGVTWDLLADANELRAAGADFIARNPIDILDILVSDSKSNF